MKAIPRNAQLALALSLAAALVVLLAAWLIPLPRLVLGEEEQSATRMPQTRVDVSIAESAFAQAETSYKTYISSHNVGAVLATLESSVAAARANPGNSQMLAALKSAAQPVVEYTTQLQAYAAAGETYFDRVKHYDDELMSWTRSLGANSEALRPDTWPIVEYLKLYPPPTGEKTDYQSVGSAAIEPLKGVLTAATLDPSSQAGMDQYSSTISVLRTMGRSVEYVESLHAQYLTLLQGYDTKLQAVASGSENGNLSGGRTVLATGANLLIGAVLLTGLAALFIPRLRKGKEAAI